MTSTVTVVCIGLGGQRRQPPHPPLQILKEAQQRLSVPAHSPQRSFYTCQQLRAAWLTLGWKVSLPGSTIGQDTRKARKTRNEGIPCPRVGQLKCILQCRHEVQQCQALWSKAVTCSVIPLPPLNSAPRIPL